MRNQNLTMPCAPLCFRLNDRISSFLPARTLLSRALGRNAQSPHRPRESTVSVEIAPKKVEKSLIRAGHRALDLAPDPFGSKKAIAAMKMGPKP
jgi:hypothetical protein